MQTFQELIINRKALEERVKFFEPTKPEVILKIYDLVTNMRMKYELGRDEKILSGSKNQIVESIDTYHNSELLLFPDYLKKINPEQENFTERDIIEAKIKMHKILRERPEELININKMYSDGYDLLDSYGHKPAIITPFNFDKNNTEHMKHAFGGYWKVEKNNPITEIIGKSIFDSDIEKYAVAVFNEDNATPISKDGIVLGIITQMIDLNLNNIKSEYPDYPSNLLMLAGGHSRFNSSAGWSYIFKDCPTLAYGESGYVRIFKNGLTIFSTVKTEQQAIAKFLEEHHK